MALTGRCYCGEVRYEAGGEPRVRAQCTCRECQYITGGSENLFMVMPADAFRYVQGAPKSFTRSDIPNPGTREFCPNCGTHLTTRIAADPTILVLKVGTLDDPSVFGQPQLAFWVSDKQPYHLIPEGVRAFESMPGR
jgi:hypothetical protein